MFFVAICRNDQCHSLRECEYKCAWHNAKETKEWRKPQSQWGASNGGENEEEIAILLYESNGEMAGEAAVSL